MICLSAYALRAIAAVLFIVLIVCVPDFASAKPLPKSARSERVLQKQKPLIAVALSEVGLSLGAEVFIRVFKQPSILEVWVKADNNTFSLFKSYAVCDFSGDLGPKLATGDRQSPEGFYFVGPGQLNPWSRFHLSFNIGFPNRYDRYHKRTGSALMIHGNCVSVGCYAMTDAKIEEIYTLMHAAMENGQAFVRVHIFPFPLSESNLSPYEHDLWYSFWKNLKTGYDWFEEKRVPPNVEVEAGEYIFNE